MTKDAIYSTMVKSGGTIFIDLKKAKNGNPFLAITQSGKDANGNQTRQTIRIFGDGIDPFLKAIGEAAAARTKTVPVDIDKDDGLPF